MTENSARKHAVNEIAKITNPRKSIDYKNYDLTADFGSNVFNVIEMQRRLPVRAFDALTDTLKNGKPLDESLAQEVANAMKEWAVEKGATHFTHWFQPMTGLTAEKHDSFTVPVSDGRAIQDFSGKELIKGEPDASSFPSGGIRATFEARGYTAWDPTSPAFIVESVNGATLCIPTAFFSYTGEALDQKVPLLRSIEVVTAQIERTLKLFGKEFDKSPQITAGIEQEYFLIDRHFYLQRPDLINSGRTLFGAKPPKGQEMEDHYFGNIRSRVLAFMMDAELEMIKLGIPVKTRHNEVAPAQFEVAPLFESVNVAVDHNMLIMRILRSTAKKNGFACLLHEKPFNGVNGSGKHNNWSMVDGEGNNLMDPGKTPSENAQFLFFLTAVISAVYRRAKLLRSSVAVAGNDHRLGANEAPPAIISIFLGDQLSDIVEGLIKGQSVTSKRSKVLEVGVSTLPNLARDTTDRNRTSPFAFTGNKFEFRAGGSSQSVSLINTVLNTIIAESLDLMAGQLEKDIEEGKDFNEALQAILQHTLKYSKDILFNGDGYSDEWPKEAKKRGLPNIPTSAEAILEFAAQDSKDLFEKYHIFTPRETESRMVITFENYIKAINIEALLTEDMARTMILPAAIKYQKLLAESISATVDLLGEDKCSAQIDILKHLTGLISDLKSAIDALGEKCGEHNPFSETGVAKHAKFYREEVLPAINKVRDTADEIEGIIDDEAWPLPKYREMLFIY